MNLKKMCRKKWMNLNFIRQKEVWPKIEEKIREKNRKRRILFFILFSSIGLMLAGYGLYNLSERKTRSEAQHKLSEGNKPNDESKTGNSKNQERNEETITIKPNVPAENIKQANKVLIVARQEQVTQSGKEEKHVTLMPERNPGSQKQDISTLNINQEEQKKDNRADSTSRGNAGISSFTQQPIITDTNQREIAKQGNKNLAPDDTTGSKLEESKDTRSVQAASKKKGDKVPGKITWGINFSAGTSVITEDAFSFKSSSANADMQFASYPGNSTGGGPLTGGGGPGTYSRYPQSQSKPAFAFKAGINARKNISKRSSLSAGLGYSYLADKIKVGIAQGGTQSQSAFSLSYYTGAASTNLYRSLSFYRITSEFQLESY